MSKIHVKLRNVPGHATCEGEPSEELLDAINKMAELAYQQNTRECGVCWGGGKIDINNDMETIDCWFCGGTGRVKTE